MMRIVTRNLGWKLSSLGAATLLWIVYSGARELTTSVPAPVQYRNIPRDLEISSEIVEQAHLILRGPSPLLTRLSGGSLAAVVDLGEVRTPGERTITLGRRSVELPAGVILERVIPAQVRLKLERRISREVPVHPRFENVPAAMEVAGFEVRPEKLTIIGPESRVNSIEQIETDLIDLRQLSEEGEARTSAYSGNPQVNFVGPPSVQVWVRLAPAKGETNRKQK